MKRAIVAAIAVTMLAGCGLLRPPLLTCEDVPGAKCSEAHEEALAHGLVLEDGQQVSGVVVRATDVRLCNQGDQPLFDVSFELRGRSQPVVVTVGATNAGRLTVCTW